MSDTLDRLEAIYDNHQFRAAWKHFPALVAVARAAERTVDAAERAMDMEADDGVQSVYRAISALDAALAALDAPKETTNEGC